jgi:flagellar operon protein
MTALPIYPGTPPPAPVRSGQAVKSRDTGQREIDPAIFRRELDSRIRPSGITFSRHAAKRLQMRGIEITPQGMERIENAMDRAEEKGSRDALILAGPLALVVSVTNRTVVTVMNSENMQKSVVTNIDSAVLA